MLRTRRLMSGLLIAIAGYCGSLPARGEEPDGAAPRRLYLDEFRPQPALKVPLHPLTRAKFPCVNVHFHPGRLSAEELDEALGVMDQANIAVSVSLDGLTGSRFADHLQLLREGRPDRFVAFVRMDYIGDGDANDPATWDVHAPDFGLRMADRLTEAVRNGACGLKLLKDLGLMIRDREGRLIAPDDSRFDAVWQRAGELGIPVLWHCADPVAFFHPIDERNERWEELFRRPDWSFHRGDFPSHDELIEARKRVIARHPETRFICAHFADIPEDLARLSRDLDELPNMFVEFAARISEIGRQPFTARDFFLRHQDRILFGTDGVPPMTELIPHFQMLETRDEYFPYEDDPFPPQGLWNIYGLDLPDDVLRQVYFENAARLIPGVRDALARYGERHPEFAAVLRQSRSPARWESDIREFEEQDRQSPPRPGGVLFTGSSSVRMWNLEESFPGRGYVNRGFGGCEASDVAHFARRIVLPHRPATIACYAGDNDLASGKSPQQIADDFLRFVRIVRESLPETRIIYLPVKPSASRWGLYPKQVATNALIAAACADDPLLETVDLATPLLGSDGRPDAALFLDDRLHLSPAGYALWTQRLLPLLDSPASR
ncbi:MAG: amidohydrolase family protein [Planctomyces sp.]|nr:amidohydrolase family protein [Planctomyces sp.]